MIARRSIALLAVALALTTFGMTSAGAQATRGASDPMSVGKLTPIDGVYHVTTTAEELRAVPTAVVGPYAYGDGTLVFDRGWARLRQASDEGSSWTTGTFTLRDNILVMTWAAAGGVPGQKILPREVHKLRTSLYRGQLEFSVVPGPDSPVEFCVKPWQRTGDAPSAAFKIPPTAVVGTWKNGRRVLVLRKGRFSLGKKAATPKPGNTYKVLGDAIRLRTGLGELSEYTWSIERGLLKLSHPLGNSQSPYWINELIRKPWQRVRR
jgi:hypothetical protein